MSTSEAVPGGPRDSGAQGQGEPLCSRAGDPASFYWRAKMLRVNGMRGGRQEAAGVWALSCLAGGAPSLPVLLIHH